MFVVSGFPGVGKTTFFKNCENREIRVVDSDSSKYSWLENGERNPLFPGNYIGDIMLLRYVLDVVLVSFHKEVRDSLVDYGVPFVLVYPDISLKDVYIELYRSRGDSEEFVNLLSDNWEKFIIGCELQTRCEKIVLGEGQFLDDVISNNKK